MFVTKENDVKVYDHIDPWGETLLSVAWEIRASYHCTLGFTPGRAMIGRDMLFNLTSIFYRHVLTARNQRKVDVDNVCKKSRQARHDYAMENIVYVEKTGIYRKLYDKNQGPYIITEVFTNGTVRFKRGSINE